MDKQKSVEIAAAFRAGKPIDDAIRKAVRQAVFGKTTPRPSKRRRKVKA